MGLLDKEPSEEGKAEEKSRQNFWVAVAVCGGLSFTFGQEVLRYSVARNIGFAAGSLLLPWIISLAFKDNRKIIAFAITWLIAMICQIGVYLYNS